MLKQRVNCQFKTGRRLNRCQKVSTKAEALWVITIMKGVQKPEVVESPNNMLTGEVDPSVIATASDISREEDRSLEPTTKVILVM